MKFKKKNRAPLSHSNLTQHENLRSHYDPNGSWTGTPDGWDKDIASLDAKRDDRHDVEAARDDHDLTEYANSGGGSRQTEADRDVYGKYMPTENGYVQSEGVRTDLEDGLTSGGVEAGQDMSDSGDIEAGRDVAEYPLEGQVAPADGESYEQNTRDMQGHDYPHHTADNGMAETEAGGDFYTPQIRGENGEYEKRAMDDLAPANDDVYDDNAPMNIEAGSDFYHEKLNTEVGKELYHYDIEAAKDMNEGGDVEGGEDIYQNDIDFDPDKYESGEWKKRPEERPAKKRDIEIGREISPDAEIEVGTNGSDENVEIGKNIHPDDNVESGIDMFSGANIDMGSSIYPLGTLGTPVGEGGYPSVPDGELTMDQAGLKEDVTPVQDADDL